MIKIGSFTELKSNFPAFHITITNKLWIINIRSIGGMRLVKGCRRGAGRLREREQGRQNLERIRKEATKGNKGVNV